MANTLGEALEQPILLFEMIQELRIQLQASINEAKDQNLRFAVKDIELELQVAVARETVGSAGLKFWVLDAKGGHKASKQTTHTFRLTLEPISGDALHNQPRGTPLVADETTLKPK